MSQTSVWGTDQALSIANAILMSPTQYSSQVDDVAYKLQSGQIDNITFENAINYYISIGTNAQNLTSIIQNVPPTSNAVNGTVPTGGVSVPGENPSYNFESMFPKQTAQLINLGAAETQLSQYVNSVATNLQNFENLTNPKLVNLGNADTTLSNDLNNEINYINTKFATIDAKLSQLGTSQTQLGANITASGSGGGGIFGGITGFFGTLFSSVTQNPTFLIIAIIVVAILILKR